MSAFDSAHSSAAAAERNTRRSGSDGRVVPRARANSRCFQTFKVRTPSGERLWDEAFAITGRVIFFPCALFPFNFMLFVFFTFFNWPRLLFLAGERCFGERESPSSETHLLIRGTFSASVCLVISARPRTGPAAHGSKV